MNCPLCSRELGSDNVDEHHLIPKAYKGKEKEPVHMICHRKIHSVFSESELYKYYHTWDRILENYEIQKFVKWVSKKDPSFYSGSDDTKKKKAKRRKR